MFQNKFQTLSIFTIVLLLHIIAGMFYGQYGLLWVVIVIACYLLLLYLGSILINWNFYLKSKKTLPKLSVRFDEGGFRINQNTKNIALAYIGLNQNTEDLIPILKQAKVKVHFFIESTDIIQYNDQLQALVKNGQKIAGAIPFKINEVWTKSTLIENKITALNRDIEYITQEKPKFYFPHKGVTGPALTKALKKLELTSVSGAITLSSKKIKSKKIKTGHIIMIDTRHRDLIAITQNLIQVAKARELVFVTDL